MPLDPRFLEQGRREAALAARREAEDVPTSTTSVIRYTSPRGPQTMPSEVTCKYTVERPYLPKNRRCKRFAIS